VFRWFKIQQDVWFDDGKAMWLIKNLLELPAKVLFLGNVTRRGATADRSCLNKNWLSLENIGSPIDMQTHAGNGCR